MIDRSKLLRRIAPNTVAATIRKFMSTDYFNKQIRASTRHCWSFALVLAENPEALGALDVNEIRTKHVQAFLNGFADRPGSQRNARSALKSWEKWAIAEDELPYPIVGPTTLVKHVDRGHAPWTDEQIEWAINNLPEHWARVIILGAHTGQRVSDLCRMQHNHIETYKGCAFVRTTQVKTNRRLRIPFSQQLLDAIATWPRTSICILTRADGTPWTAHQLSARWSELLRRNPKIATALRERGAGFDEDALPTLHGLRATLVVKLRQEGFSEGEIANTVGMSVPMVARYAREADQREQALKVHLRRGAAVVALPTKRRIAFHDPFSEGPRARRCE